MLRNGAPGHARWPAATAGTQGRLAGTLLAVLLDLNGSLGACLRRWLPTDVQIAFCAPVDGSVLPPPTRRTLSAFCFEVRTDTSISAAERVLVRDADGRAAGWQLPVKRYLAWFLLSAHCPAVADNSSDGASDDGLAMLDAVLTACAQHPVIPTDCLQGTLVDSGLPVELTCAPAQPPVSATQVWSSLRVPARASVTMLAIAAVVPPLLRDLAPAARNLDLGVDGVGVGGVGVDAERHGGNRGENDMRRWGTATIRESPAAGLTGGPTSRGA